MNENELIQSARSGDSSALGTLLMQYRNLVASVVYRSVYDQNAHKDVIQNIFYKVVKVFGDFKGSCKFSTWLYRIAVNESVDHNRKRLQKSNVSEELSDQVDMFSDLNAEDGLEIFSRKEIHQSVNAIVNELPLDQKTAFSLFYFCGYSGKDAASVLNISEDNFFMKLKSARDKVRKALISKGWKL
jgi:RNA polymerase sigma-70 factor (ECF subfamily)